MCGIIGLTKGEEKIRIQNGLASLKHRGPDDNGVFSNNEVSLGHCRLSVIDLSPLGHQPMGSENDNVISFNGEIYNYKELKSELEQKGIVFKGGSDTEVILRGFEVEGKNFFSKLRGMWALALYDKKSGEIILSRDHFGIKPLYYSIKNGVLSFASEMRSLRNLLSSVTPNSTHYFLFYNLGYFPEKYTCYREIQKLLPGEILVWNLNKKSFTSERLFISSKEKLSNLSFEEAVGRIGEVLKNSIQAHYVSDVPVGILLSGGTDSSLIAAISKSIGQDPTCYHVAIKGSVDAKYAKKIASFLGLNLIEKELDLKSLEEEYQELFSWIDGPTSDVSIIPTSLVYKTIRKETKVVLSGEGGDELFGGYIRHNELSPFVNVNKMYSSFLSSFYSSSLGGVKKYNPIVSRTEYIWQKMSGDLLGVYLKNVKTISFPIEEDKIREFLFDFYKNSPYKNILPTNLFFDFGLYISDSLMYKNDLASMHSSIEARVPFIDKEVVSSAAQIPELFRLSSEYSGKVILKSLLSQFLPKSLVERPKKGFGFSFDHYELASFREDYKKAALFHSHHSEEFGISSSFKELLSPSHVETICKKFPRFAFSLITNWKIFV